MERRESVNHLDSNAHLFTALRLKSLTIMATACRRVLAATTSICGDGPYYANGGTFAGSKHAGDRVYNVSSNLEGDLGNTRTLHSGDPRDLIASVNVSALSLPNAQCCAVELQQANIVLMTSETFCVLLGRLQRSDLRCLWPVSAELPQHAQVLLHGNGG